MAHDPEQNLIGQTVVLDTTTPIVYIGRLESTTASAFVLVDADVHDCRDGHASKEVYVAEVRREGVTVNRSRVFVMKSAIISVSRLEDIVDT